MSDAKREGRSLGKVQVELTELGQEISDLWPHVRAACHMVGIPEPPHFGPSPRPTEGPEAPMVIILADLHDLKDWVKAVNEGLSTPLGELVPEFYNQMGEESKTKIDPQKV